MPNPIFPFSAKNLTHKEIICRGLEVIEISCKEIFYDSPWVTCSKCLNRYETYAEAEAHIKKCRPRFKDIIFRQDHLTIAHITPKSSPLSRFICEQIAAMERRENHWDFPMLNKNSWICKRLDFTSEVFLLRDGRSIIGYIVIQNRRLLTSKGNEPELIHLIANFFIVPEYRRKGFMQLLLRDSLKFLDETLDSVVFMVPFTGNGYECIYKITQSLGISHIRVWPENAPMIRR